jgi:acyl-CoA thioesterase
VGDEVTARSVEVWKRGRSGLYDVTLTNQNGDKIAVMRGHARMTKGMHIEKA